MNSQSSVNTAIEVVVPFNSTYSMVNNFTINETFLFYNKKASDKCDIEIILKSNIEKLLIDKFNSEKEKNKLTLDGNEENLNKFFNKILLHINEIKPSKVSLSITKSNSIFLIFYNFPNYETYFEVFYTQDSPDDNVEAVTTIYSNKVEFFKEFGGIDEIFNEVKNIFQGNRVDSIRKNEKSISQTTSSFQN